MKDRINKFLELEQISAAKFADDIGVQRSSISHILSGRNNPSYDFIQKILNKYKKLNAEWLIMGTGNIYKTVVQRTLFDDLNKQQNSAEFKMSDKPIAADIIDNSNLNETSDKIIKPFNNRELLPSLTEKKIEKVILLYTDKTFSTYNTE